MVRIILSLSEATDNICKGQIMDLLPEKYISNEENYLRMIYLKTASLIETAVLIGGLLGEASEEDLSKLRIYGKNIGIAFQIADDILGIFGDSSRTGKPVGNDIRMGKRTLLILYALDKLDDDERRLFEEVFGNSDAEENDVRTIIDILRNIGVKSYADNYMRGLVTSAKEALKDLPENIYRKYLEDISEYIITREL
jgi:geranylgeranyl diphosphate synthase type I